MYARLTRAVPSPFSLGTARFLQGCDMSEFNINLTLDLTCNDSDEADEELDLLCDYISDRLLVTDQRTVMQALAEIIIELNDQNMVYNKSLH